MTSENQEQEYRDTLEETNRQCHEFLVKFKAIAGESSDPIARGAFAAAISTLMLRILAPMPRELVEQWIVVVWKEWHDQHPELQ